MIMRDGKAYVGDPTIEILAILLYLNDENATPDWLSEAEEDRQLYRDMAMGNRPLGDG